MGLRRRLFLTNSMECNGRQHCDNAAAERRYCDGREYRLRRFYSTRGRACTTILCMTGAQSNGWQCCDNTVAEWRHCNGREYHLRRFYSTRERACTTILCMTGAQSSGWQCCDNTVAEWRHCNGREYHLRRIEAEIAGILLYRGKKLIPHGCL